MCLRALSRIDGGFGRIGKRWLPPSGSDPVRVSHSVLAFVDMII